MRESLLDAGPGGTALGEPSWRERVGRKWVETADWYHALLIDRVAHLDIWETQYLQVLSGEDAVLEWVRGTGQRPFLEGLAEPESERFLGVYRQRLRAAYPPRGDGTTLFPFRRLFMVARKP